MCWNISDGFILLDENGFGFESYYYCKVEATVYVSSCMITPLIKSIFASVVWLVGNVKSRYLCHEVATESVLLSGSDRDKRCYLSISCLLFLFWAVRENKWKMDKYLKDDVAYSNILSPTVFIIVNFLLPLDFVTINIYVRLCFHPVAFVQSLVLWPCHQIFCVLPHKSSLGVIHIT